ncbi:hypothetical protein DEO72_LG5g1585 [Vigna unguiculata]|uniref:Uncharacterized protein n=1 Tax=Vigna unguiculata TaxID=3917 RepID=A0A4D6LYA7_VIGUN|nr:hypothetical protein DEO72_LG5g1585 [Vigna unguiculata]
METTHHNEASSRICTILRIRIGSRSHYSVSKHLTAQQDVTAAPWQFCNNSNEIATPPCKHREFISTPLRNSENELAQPPSMAAPLHLHLDLAPATATRIGAANPNSGERRFATCHPIIAQSKSNLVKHSKAGQTVKFGQRLVKREGFNYKY